MIKFFRNIRQKLIKEGKTSNYLKYAFGEIVLVMIGILLALQVNNWNNKMKLRVDNKIFLEKMITDLQLNKARMHHLAVANDGGWISLEQAVKNCDSLLKLSYKGLQEKDLYFIINTEFDAAGAKLNLHNGTHEELINTGKLYTIGSDSLITNIKNYYKRIERETEYNVGNTNDMYRGFELMQFGLNKLILDYQMDSINFNIHNYSWYFDKTSEHYQNIQIGINIMKVSQKHNFNKMLDIIDDSDALIAIIKNEIKHTYK